MSEADNELGFEAEVVDEESAGQIEGSQGTPTNRERAQDVNERAGQPQEPPPAPDGRNAPH